MKEALTMSHTNDRASHIQEMIEPYIETVLTKDVPVEKYPQFFMQQLNKATVKVLNEDPIYPHLNKREYGKKIAVLLVVRFVIPVKMYKYDLDEPEKEQLFVFVVSYLKEYGVPTDVIINTLYRSFGSSVDKIVDKEDLTRLLG